MLKKPVIAPKKAKAPTPSSLKGNPKITVHPVSPISNAGSSKTISKKPPSQLQIHVTSKTDLSSTKSSLKTEPSPAQVNISKTSDSKTSDSKTSDFKTSSQQPNNNTSSLLSNTSTSNTLSLSPVSSPESCTLLSPTNPLDVPPSEVVFNEGISAAPASALNIPLPVLEDSSPRNPSDSPSFVSSSSSSTSFDLKENFLKGTKPKVDDFEFLQTLGSGMFGMVRLAKHKATSLPVAIKVLNKTRVWQLGAVRNLRQEKDVLLEVAHPRIVNLFATMQDAENIYLIMEFVSGGELFTHLRQQEFFDVFTTRYYVAQLVTAIAHLHAAGIVYRDIKPENIMLDSHGQLKLTDFGFAKKIEDLSFSSCGTPEYLAPEQIRSEGHNAGVDWWAVGILTYEMLEGTSPFQAENIADVYKMALNYAPCFVNITDPTAKAFIKKLLAKDRSKRLGCGLEGAEEVKNHPFFSGIDWKNIELGLDQAPIHVSVASEVDTRNFVLEEKGEDDEEEALPMVNTGPVDQAEFDSYF